MPWLYFARLKNLMLSDKAEQQACLHACMLEIVRDLDGIQYRSTSAEILQSIDA